MAKRQLRVSKVFSNCEASVGWRPVCSHHNFRITKTRRARDQKTEGNLKREKERTKEQKDFSSICKEKKDVMGFFHNTKTTSCHKDFPTILKTISHSQIISVLYWSSGLSRVRTQFVEGWIHLNQIKAIEFQGREVLEVRKHVCLSWLDCQNPPHIWLILLIKSFLAMNLVICPHWLWCSWSQKPHCAGVQYCMRENTHIKLTGLSSGGLCTVVFNFYLFYVASSVEKKNYMFKKLHNSVSQRKLYCSYRSSTWFNLIINLVSVDSHQIYIETRETMVNYMEV